MLNSSITQTKRLVLMSIAMIWLAAGSLSGALAQAPKETAEQDIVHKTDIVYGKGGDTELKLDIAYPENLEKTAPCIVVIHGGAWRQGNKKQHTAQIKLFAQAGYVSATIQYRFCPEHRFPAQIQDVKCAVRFLRAHAEQYKIDPDRIGAIGFSAGAHLSMMLGTMDSEDGLEGNGGWANQSSKVQAVVSFFGPTDFVDDVYPIRSIPLIYDFIGGTVQDMKDSYRKASPITYLNKGDAAMLLFQGTDDVLVPYTQAIKMVKAMTHADVPGRVEFLIDAGHGWGGKDLTETVDKSKRFFARYLKHRQ